MRRAEGFDVHAEMQTLHRKDSAEKRLVSAMLPAVPR
jgi:hypothetical protein